MKIKLTDFMAYMECPRKYAHNLVNATRAVKPPWLLKREELTKLTFAEKLPLYSEANAVNYRLAGQLREVLQRVGIVKKTWTARWGKDGKYTIEHHAYVDKEGTFVYIHSSSSDFSKFAEMKATLMLLRISEMKVFVQTTSKARLKKTESWDAFAKRFASDIRYSAIVVKNTAQELEANKYWILQVLNKIRQGHVNQFNPAACIHTVEECEYQKLCWGTQQYNIADISNDTKVTEPDKIIVRERELPFDKKKAKKKSPKKSTKQ